MRKLIVIVFLMVSLAAPALGQGTEQDIIQQAQEHVEKGRFEAALRLLADTPFKSPDGQRESRVLSIKVYLVLDNLAEAHTQAAQLLSDLPGYEPEFNDPQGYKDLIEVVRRQLAASTIASVSKIAERPEEAPATVYIIQEEEIKGRGYNDLIELLKDLPGFDIMGFYSATYSNIYQRGYRSTNTERTLLLIDGVEENDLYFNIPYLSRQYPISNIRRVEVIYGPASTLYGPNAFVGVINVVTKSYTGKEGAPTGEIHAGTGSYQTYWADASLGNTSKSGRVQWNVTSRVFWSQEMDLSTDPLAGQDFDYALAQFDSAAQYETNLTQSVSESVTLADLGLPASHPYFTETVANGQRTISPTAAGIAAALAVDQALYTGGIDGRGITGFSNPTFSYYLRGQLKIDRFTLTAQHWTREEGTSARYRDVVVAPSATGSTWTPQNYTLALQYATPLNRDGTWTFSSLTSYRYHRLDPNRSSIIFARSYWQGNLGLANLISDDPTTLADNPIWVQRHYFQEARQLRTEQKFVYAATNQLAWVSGLEVRNTQLQGDYLVSYDTVNHADATGCADWPSPEACGIVSSNQALGGNQYGTWDVGLYTQAQYRFNGVPLKLVLGTRLDYNRIRTAEGFGWALSPRAVLVYAQDRVIAKAIYARGIQNPSQWSRYSTGGTRIPSNKLQEETINNLEATVRYAVPGEQGSPEWVLEAAGYYSQINNVVGLRNIVSGPDSSRTQNANLGTYNILGAQVVGEWSPLPYLSVWANYSYTLGEVASVDTSQNAGEEFAINNRIADIAPHQVKAGVRGHFFKDRLVAQLRGQYVAARPTGGGTTNPYNAGQYSTPNGDFFQDYLLLYATLTWDLQRWVSDKNLGSGLQVQAQLNNLLNSRYYNTGPLNGDGTTNPSLIPQRGFHAQFRILYNF